MSELIKESGEITRGGGRTIALGKLIEFASGTFSMYGVSVYTLTELRAAIRVAIVKIQSETEN